MQTFSSGQMINHVSPFLCRFRDLEQSTEINKVINKIKPLFKEGST